MADASSEMIEMQKKADNGRLYLTSLILFVHGMAYGTAYVYGSIILPHQIGAKNTTTSTNTTLVQLSEEEGSWSVSITPLGLLVGNLASSPIAERFGRKIVIIISEVMFVIGYALIFFSDSVALFISGRTVVTMGLGLAEMTAFVLLSEISTIKLQGPLSNIVSCATSYGYSFLYVIAVFINIDYLIYLAILFPLIFILSSPFLLESPHWLVRKGKTEKASQVYEQLRGKIYEGTQQEIDEVKSCISSTTSISLSHWTSPRVLHPLCILLTMFFFIAVCGVDAPLMLYGPVIFQQIGVTLPPAILSSVVAIGGSLGYTVIFSLMNRVNRRPLYMSACVIMSLSCLLLSVSIHLSLHPVPFIPHLLIQITICVSAFCIPLGYSLGFKTVTYAVPGALLSPEDKSLGVTLAYTMRLITTFGVLKVYPTLMQHASLSTLFGCHGALIVLAAFFCWKFLPETKDKSITEMHLYFTKQE